MRADANTVGFLPFPFWLLKLKRAPNRVLALSEIDSGYLESVMASQVFNQRSMMAPSDPASNVLALIATTVLADASTSRCGSDRFIRETRNLNALKKLGIQTSETRLLLWYELNKDAILEKMKSKTFIQWFYGVLDALETLIGKIQTLNLMRSLSVSGSQVNLNGQALLTLAEHHWRTD